MAAPQMINALAEGVEALLEHAIAETTEKVIEKATREFEVELRRRVAETTMQVGHFYTLDTMRDGLTITVKVPTNAQKA